MIVSFTGAQSTGKSTMLGMCCNDPVFRKFHCVPEVTRKVKREQNLNINEEGDSVTQLFILKEHLHNHYLKGDSLLDRCIVDGIVYTEYLYHKDLVDRWVYTYAMELYKLLAPRLDVIFYTDPGDVELVDDGERSVNVEFRNDIILGMRHYLGLSSCKDKVVTLSGTPAERMKTILKTIKNYEHR
jgi:nicotinamide riboside kinase